MGFTETGRAVTPVLDIAYEAAGSAAGSAAGASVVLFHGFPYDVRCFDGVADILATRGVRVVAPMLRGFGDTRFRSPDTLRSGQQGALGQDAIELMDALGIDRAVIGGFDWGGRAACVTAALRPERVAGLVTVGGYNIQNIANSGEPLPPAEESAAWYTHYFLSDRGRRGLERYRDELCELLWRQWSPTWADAASAFLRSAPSLHNPDFIDVVIHSYRHRRQAAIGDARYGAIEAALAERPVITVPTIVLDVLADGLGADDSTGDRPLFSGPFEIRALDGIGHNPPQEAPDAFAAAVLALLP